MEICFITDLPVWSLGKGRGAPSFYNTLKLYSDKGCKVKLLTTEKGLDLSELKNLEIINLPKLGLTNNRKVFGLVRLLHKYNNHRLNQKIGFKFLKEHAKSADIVYAYEIGFVEAAFKFTRLNSKKLISRFQGTVLTGLVEKSTLFKKLRLSLQFRDQISALKVPSDLTIMTDDGTKGLSVIDRLRGNVNNVVFWRNGVDLPEIENLNFGRYTQRHSKGDIVFSSISRVQKWKRLDRSLDIFERVVQNHPDSHYYIGGDGPELQNVRNLVTARSLDDKVTFLGALQKEQIYQVMLDSDFFLSSYELSNLGNPLFESIVCDCVPVTLNNGATAELIEDFQTGIISEEGEYVVNAEKIIKLIGDKGLANAIKMKAKQRLKENFMDWQQRMDLEFKNVKEL